MQRLLITGAAGFLGNMMRQRLAHLAPILRLSDVADLGAAAANEELVQCNLDDAAAVDDLVAGCDAIVHLGGRSIEDKWSVIRQSNIEGVVNLYEAARKHGMPRIIFASSNHAIGYHKQTERLDASATTRPDGLYGVSKVFGESMASMYYDKFGQQTAIVRIGSCLDAPVTHRMLATWFSPDDFVSLIERAFTVPHLGCPIIYGASDNSTSWWDNSQTAYLGWQPKDNSDKFRDHLMKTVPQPAPDAPDVIYQGGVFTADGIHPEDED
ncbi:NAD-dependent epimerase/dehydratase family protein [Pseudoprimorskyibacter insulae]|uniref:Uronate dehydrogenase n=1 Tax=Pseudoprimorskyibacter insulae TaxID=1695997 RepID=A0A2R8APW9_9RHOB|nr:NAD(P)-dependent oxidoreductase [Pseudoprimorskyibacter insulae]SPF78128.1 Uronate dehydrogenase [Pseudoprimorskyibacter insulae]